MSSDRSDRTEPTISTNGLDAFLAAVDTPTAFTRQESARRLYASFREAAIPEMLPGSPQLVIALWRFARAVGQACGRLTDDETLESAFADLEPCPWTKALRPKLSPSQRALLRQDSTGAIAIAAHSEHGLPLLPPIYKPREAVELWCNVADVVFSDLLLSQMRDGPQVKALLLNVDAAPYCAISKYQILAFEDLIIDECQKVLVRHGERAAMVHFRNTYTLTRKESIALTRLARADALEYGRSSIEEDRAMMVAMLKDYLSRSKESLNMADEMRALKQLAQVQGLTRTEPEDRAAEFLGVIKSVSAKQDAALIPQVAEAFNVERADLEEAANATERVIDMSVDLQRATSDISDAVYTVIEHLPPPGAEHETLLEFDVAESDLPRKQR